MSRITAKMVKGTFERFCAAVPAPEGMRWVLQEKDIIPWSLGAVEIATYPNGVWSQPFGHLAWDKNADAWEALRCMAFVAEYMMKPDRPIHQLATMIINHQRNPAAVIGSMAMLAQIVLKKPKVKNTHEYEVQGNYGTGWDLVDTLETREEARESLKNYRENQPGAQFRIRRVKTED